MKRNSIESYKVVVDIIDPETKEGMYSGLQFNLDAEFSCNEKDYGNGYYAYVGGKGFQEMCYDLRYTKFNPAKEEQWIKDWANGYWSGKDGAWVVRSIKIEKV